jgi:hypothetical protein
LYIWFLQLFGGMGINSTDLSPFIAMPGFTTDEFDEFHRINRDLRGIPD